MGLWLLTLPQVLFSAAVQAHCEEYGTTLPPITEEEEVHECVLGTERKPPAPPPHMDLAEALLPHWQESILPTLHGEVPDPPPWA